VYIIFASGIQYGTKDEEDQPKAAVKCVGVPWGMSYSSLSHPPQAG